MKNLLISVLFIFLSSFSSITYAQQNKQENIEQKQSNVKLFGLQLDLGVPDGIVTSVIFSPTIYWIKLQGGFATNVVDFGYRFGITLDPINFCIAPTFTTEIGHYVYADISNLVKEENFPKVSYSYWNNQLGLEFGDPDGFRFFLRAGISHLWLNVNNLQPYIELKQKDTTTKFTVSDPNITAWVTPSLKLGFSLMLF
jgi:hypothetical protein